MPAYPSFPLLPAYSHKSGRRSLSALPAVRKDSEESVSLESIIVGKSQALAAILGDIAKEIGKREILSAKVVELIDQHYCYLKTKLYETDLWPLGHNRAIENRRSKLEQQLDALLQEKRMEHVKCWQDISRLKSEFRTWFKQHSDLEQRARLIMGK